MDIWIGFSIFAYVLVVLSAVIIWRNHASRGISLISLIQKWPLVDKMLGVVWVVQLATIFYTRNPRSFALNSVLLLYLISRLNREILDKKQKR